MEIFSIFIYRVVGAILVELVFGFKPLINDFIRVDQKYG